MTKKTNPEKTLADLKPGDPVVYNYGGRSSYGGGSLDVIKYVERMTKTLIVLKDGDRFKVRSGDSANSGNDLWGPRPHITVASRKDVLGIERAVKARRLTVRLRVSGITLGDAFNEQRSFNESRATKAQLTKLEKLSDALDRVADIVREFDPSFKLHPDDEQDDDS